MCLLTLNKFKPFDDNKTLWQLKEYRIKLFIDFDFDLEWGEVIEEGYYGLILEKWNPEIDKGWEVLDSVWGVDFYGIETAIDQYIVYPNELDLLDNERTIK